MTTLAHALDLAEQDKKNGHLASFYVESGILYGESPDGGFYKLYDPRDWNGQPHQLSSCEVC